jgi:pilus assembly protein FimV
MRNKRILNLAIASALGLLAPVSVHAFGLGKIQIDSALNEPFSAQIPVTALKSGEASNLQVRLASNEEFEKAGLERNFILTDFTFEIVKNSATDVVIKVTSTKSVREPLLDFLLTASAGNGRLIREYTVLLDPPTHVMAKPQTQQLLSSPLTDSDATIDETTVEQLAKPVTSIVSTQYDNNQYGVTTSTDTLWNIAKKVRPSTDITMNQMMIALLNENTKAFSNQNINGLKKGYAITIPSATQISAISKQQANQAVREQNEQWKNRNRSVTPTTAPAAVDSVNLNQSKASQTDQLNEQISSAVIGGNGTAETESKLSLVTPSQGEQISDDANSELGDENLQTISEQLTYAQETIEAQAQQNIEIESRMAAMEEQLETMRRLISLKDADLARLQSLLEEEQQDDAGFEEQLETVLDAAIEGKENIAEELGDRIDESNDNLETEEQAAKLLQDDIVFLEE